MKEQLYMFVIHVYKCSMSASFIRRHTSKRQSNSFHTSISKPGVMVSRAAVIFFFTSVMLTGCGGTDTLSCTVELSSECPLNRNNWFMLQKLQHTKRTLLRSRHYRFVTSETEREEGSGIAHAHKTWTPAVSFHVENLLMRVFSKP